MPSNIQLELVSVRCGSVVPGRCGFVGSSVESHFWFDERCWHLIILGALSWQVFKLNSPIFWGGIWKRTGLAMGLVLSIWEVPKRWWSKVLFAGDQLPETLSIPPKNTSISQQNESIWGEDMEWLIQHPDGSNRDFFEWKTLIDTYLQKTQWLLITLGWWKKSGEPVEVGSYWSFSHIPGFFCTIPGG